MKEGERGQKLNKPITVKGAGWRGAFSMHACLLAEYHNLGYGVLTLKGPEYFGYQKTEGMLNQPAVVFVLLY